jgi:hypothetical protein
VRELVKTNSFVKREKLLIYPSHSFNRELVHEDNAELRFIEFARGTVAK